MARLTAEQVRAEFPHASALVDSLRANGFPNARPTYLAKPGLAIGKQPEPGVPWRVFKGLAKSPIHKETKR